MIYKILRYILFVPMLVMGCLGTAVGCIYSLYRPFYSGYKDAKNELYWS